MRDHEPEPVYLLENVRHNPMDVAHSTVFHLCMPDLNADLPPEIVQGQGSRLSNRSPSITNKSLVSRRYKNGNWKMQNRDCSCEFAHSAPKSQEFILGDRANAS
jgi:hypothetical protein